VAADVLRVNQPTKHAVGELIWSSTPTISKKVKFGCVNVSGAFASLIYAVVWVVPMAEMLRSVNPFPYYYYSYFTTVLSRRIFSILGGASPLPAARHTMFIWVVVRAPIQSVTAIKAAPTLVVG
jgi:hypothetical protein